MRAQPQRSLQTLIEVCTDFGNMALSPNLHRPAGQVFTVQEEEVEVLAVGDGRWSDTPNRTEGLKITPEQLLDLAKKMGYEMRPAARRQGQSSPAGRPGNRRRDWSKVKCFSCGTMGHTRARCPRPDRSLPFKPTGFVLNTYEEDDLDTRDSGRYPAEN